MGSCGVSQSGQRPGPVSISSSTCIQHCCRAASVGGGLERWTFVLLLWTESTRLVLGRRGEAAGTVPCGSILGLASAGPEIVTQGGKERKASSHRTQGVEQVGQCLEWLYNSGASCFPAGRSCDCHFLFSSSSWEEDGIGLSGGSRMFMW